MRHLDSRAVSLATLAAVIFLTGCAPAESPAPEAPDTTQAVEAAPELEPAAADLLYNGLQVSDDLLVGGQPTKEQLDRLAELGYTTIVNLRRQDEEGNLDLATIEESGLDYVHIPVAGAEDLDEEHARSLSEAIAAAEGKVVVHCGSGNRVGALFAISAFYVDGAAPDDALRTGRDRGMTSLEPAVREILGLPTAEEAAGPDDAEGGHG